MRITLASNAVINHAAHIRQAIESCRGAAIGYVTRSDTIALAAAAHSRTPVTSIEEVALEECRILEGRQLCVIGWQPSAPSANPA